MSTPPSRQPVLVARQPILDRALKVHGYELLFRVSHEAAQAGVVDGDAATAQVVLNAFIEFGLERVVGGRPAFVNATRGFLVGGFGHHLPTDRVVIEILEDIVPDAEVVTAVEDLHKAGYRLALDDLVDVDAMAPLLPFVSIAKLDITTVDEAGLVSLIERLRDARLELVAERVATQADYERCRALGFDYFQGFFLAEPTLVQGRSRSTGRVSVLRLLGVLDDPNTSLDQLEAALGSDATLSYRMMRVINSAGSAMSRQIDSLRQAIVLLGRDRIRNWVTLMLLSGLSNKSPALVSTALVRARTCEILGTSLARERTPAFFTVGLFSALDALLDQPLPVLLEKLPLSPDINAALLSREGVLGEVLTAVLAYERGAWADVSCSRLDDSQFREAYLQALAWEADLHASLDAS